ncbi:MAG: CopD family protein [Ornithinimicrobium sp.]
MTIARIVTLASIDILTRRLAAAVGFAMVLLVAAAMPALAHTDLDNTTPADGAIVDQPVDEVRLTFTLPVTELGDGVSLRGPDGQVSADVRSAQDGLVWIASVKEPLPAGTYTSQWTVAASDGHPLSGEFTFTVEVDNPEEGADSADGSAADPQDSGPAPGETEEVAGVQEESTSITGTAGDASGIAEVVARFAGAAALWGALVAGGGLAFAVAVLRGSDRQDTPVVSRAIRWSAALILLALAVRVMARAVVVNQGDLSAALSPAAITTALGDRTRWVFGLQAVGALVVLLSSRAMLRKPWAVAVGLVGLGSGHVLAGHSITAEPRWVVLAADIAHLLAAAVWVGGVVMLGVLLRHRRKHGRYLDAAALGARFSVIAAGSVAVVGVAGVVLALTILDRPQQLWVTNWGLLLLVKVAVVAVVAGMGTFNHFRVVPRLATATRRDGSGGDPAEALARSTTRETGVMIVIVLLTAWLVVAASPM